MPSPSLTLARVAFAWPDAPAPVFHDVSAHFPPGWHGLVGANGTGKSTLLGLVSGALQPTSGRITADAASGGRARIVATPQDTASITPAALALAEAWDRDAIRLRDRLGLGPSAVDRWRSMGPAALSAGERRRWLLAGALHEAPDVLLLDEPETHLDAASRAWLVEACSTFRGVGLIVAHDRDLLDRLTTTTLVLGHGGAGLARHLAVPASAALAQLDAEADADAATRAALRDAAHHRARALHASRQDAARADAARSAKHRIKGPRDRDARSMGHKVKADWAASAHGARSARAARALAEVEQTLAAAPRTARPRGAVTFDALPKGPPVVLSLHTPALFAGPRLLARDVHLDIRHDDRVHLTGRNGAGKSTLLRALLATGAQESTFFLSQELPADAIPSMRAALAAQSPADRGRTLRIAATLGADAPTLLGGAPLSAGEARKLALALALARPLSVIALDEPDNHLDLPSLTRLADALDAFPGALLLVSHDAALAKRLTRRTLSIDAEFAHEAGSMP